MTREDKQLVIDTINRFGIRKGNEIDLTVNDLSVAIWWHSPSLNLNWYPIAQIDVASKHGTNSIGRLKTVFHKEGCENENGWCYLWEDVIKTIESLEEE